MTHKKRQRCVIISLPAHVSSHFHARLQLQGKFHPAFRVFHNENALSRAQAASLITISLFFHRLLCAVCGCIMHGLREGKKISPKANDPRPVASTASELSPRLRTIPCHGEVGNPRLNSLVNRLHVDTLWMMMMLHYS